MFIKAVVAESRHLLVDFAMIDLEEEEIDKPTMAGTMKHWHVFHVIVRKE